MTTHKPALLSKPTGATAGLSSSAKRVPPGFHHLTSQRPAFTLLEVILALAILAGAVAMLGELITLSSRRASDAYAETRAQLLASSLMDEMITGYTKLEQQSKEPLDVNDSVDWVYSVSFDSTEIDSLTSVEVLVEQDLERKYRPVKYRLVRWLPSTSMDKEKDDESEDAYESSKSSEGDDG